MWELQYSTQFKKDLKRIKHNLAKIDALQTVLNQLANEVPEAAGRHQVPPPRGGLASHFDFDLNAGGRIKFHEGAFK